MARIYAAILLVIALDMPAHAQIPVIDSANLGQNILQVSKLITEIKLITEQLQNMIQNTTAGPTPWESALPMLLRLGNLLQRGQALGYTIQNIDQQFLTTFPGYVAPTDWHKSYGQWTVSSLDTLRNVLGSLGIHADSIAWDAARIGMLALGNTSATGRLAAIQAGNSIALESIGQMQRLQEIARAQTNAYVVVEANKMNKEAQNEAKTRKVLMDSARPIPKYGSSGLGIGKIGQ